MSNHPKFEFSPTSLTRICLKFSQIFFSLRNWVARIWSNFDHPYFSDHLTKKIIIGQISFFMGHNNCAKFQASPSVMSGTLDDLTRNDPIF